MNLEAYLISKKIDSAAFLKAEPELWKSWDFEFQQMHPNSFTIQKLNLINPIRRKYPLPLMPEKQEPTTPTSEPVTPPALDPKTASPAGSNPKPSMPKPVFKPKPKMS
ncbi:MAG TPA: hypothetical protein VFG46_20535 [Chryseolinea sp.]|nr:hypothetical protein [Chryseolinea sp.]